MTISIKIGTIGAAFFYFFAQIAAQTPFQNQNRIEEVVEQIGEEGDFDFNTSFEHLEHFQAHPLNLNKVTALELADLGLLSPLQIQAFMQYRAEAGALISIYELQAIPKFDLVSIRRILPYVTIRTDLNILKTNVLKMLTTGKNDLYVRYQRILETKKGFQPLAEGETASRYLGDPNRLYIRYKHHYENRLSYGITMEKDAGEEFFTGSNKQGFDFYSAHFYAKDLSTVIKTVTLGDFEAKLGQGLILWSGFGFGKGANVMNVKRTGRTLKAYTAANEASFLRGGGVTLRLGKSLETTILASYRNQDATISILDTLEAEPQVLEVSTLQLSGLHRTSTEVSNENAINQFTTGGQVKYLVNNGKNGHIGINGTFTQLDAPLGISDNLYKKFRFSGDRLLNYSLDYTFIFKNFHFFGETAQSDNGGLATLNGLLLALHRRVDMVVVQRHFQKNYQTLFGNTFSETSGVNNESGTYIGLEMRPNYHWKISMYFDMWRHPWLRFNVDAPSTGEEYLMQIDYRPSKKTLFQVRFRNEIKEKNAVGNTTPIDFLVPQTRTQTRFHFAHKISKNLELRSRVEWSIFNDGISNRSNGYLVYQDILYKQHNISGNLRFALFDTDDFNSRIYAYENDVLYAFSIPAYFYKGNRFYMNLRYRLTPQLLIEGRFAQTRMTNRATISSGLEEIQGNTRSEVKLQVRYKF